MYLLTMAISIASLHARWHHHRDKPKHLFTLVIPETDVRPYISVAYYPGGWLGAKWAGAPTVAYDGKTYLPLTFVEKNRRKIFYSIWAHFHKVIGDQPELLVCPVRP